MNRHHAVSDKALVKAAKKGDKEAAAQLYHRHVDRIHRICYRIVLDPSQVQDCVQEVWMKVFRGLDECRLGRSFTAWLNRVAANTAIDYYRTYVRQRNLREAHRGYVDTVATNEQPDETDVQEQVQSALKEMSVNQRTAFTLRYFEDMPTSRIARTLGCSESTVRVHLHRALLALREGLAGKFFR